MKNVMLFSLLWTLLLGCEGRSPSEEIAGIYVGETIVSVSHPLTGKALGTSTIRDTFWIEALGDGYQVRQTKWRFNDFDGKGWQKQQHAENRPWPAF